MWGQLSCVERLSFCQWNQVFYRRLCWLVELSFVLNIVLTYQWDWTRCDIRQIRHSLVSHVINSSWLDTLATISFLLFQKLSFKRAHFKRFSLPVVCQLFQECFLSISELFWWLPSVPMQKAVHVCPSNCLVVLCICTDFVRALSYSTWPNCDSHLLTRVGHWHHSSVNAIHWQSIDCHLALFLSSRKCSKMLAFVMFVFKRYL